MWALLLLCWPFFGTIAQLTPIPYNDSIGGTRLRRVPDPFVVVITHTNHWAEYPQPDCAGVYVGGYGSPDVSFVLTSPWCIDVPDPTDTLAEPMEVRNARNEIASSLPFDLYYPFKDSLRIGALVMSLPAGYWVPEIADMVLIKREFRRRAIIASGSEINTHGFALAVNTNPAKIMVVSYNQENCTRMYEKYKLPDWPDEIRDGSFCVFRGDHEVDNVTIGKYFYNVKVGTPCDDAMGSPVLTSDFKVLGVILKTLCDGDRSVAFAMSPAFMPPIVPPATITTTSTLKPTPYRPRPPLPPPPPYPRIPDPIKPCSATRITGPILWGHLALFSWPIAWLKTNEDI